MSNQSEKERDIVKRLRNHALPDPYDDRSVLHAPLIKEAADEIERLRAALSTEAQPEVTGAVANDEFCPHCKPCRNGERINNAETLNIKYDAVLRGLASYLGAGGSDGWQHIDPKVADEKIHWGIDHFVEVEKSRAIEAAVREKLEEAALIAEAYREVTDGQSMYIADKIRALMESPSKVTAGSAA